MGLLGKVTGGERMIEVRDEAIASIRQQLNSGGERRPTSSRRSGSAPAIAWTCSELALQPDRGCRLSGHRGDRVGLERPLRDYGDSRLILRRLAMLPLMDTRPSPQATNKQMASLFKENRGPFLIKTSL
jgi:hypothetical protein